MVFIHAGYHAHYWPLTFRDRLFYCLMPDKLREIVGYMSSLQRSPREDHQVPGDQIGEIEIVKPQVRYLRQLGKMVHSSAVSNLLAMTGRAKALYDELAKYGVSLRATQARKQTEHRGARVAKHYDDMLPHLLLVLDTASILDGSSIDLRGSNAFVFLDPKRVVDIWTGEEFSKIFQSATIDAVVGDAAAPASLLEPPSTELFQAGMDNLKHHLHSVQALDRNNSGSYVGTDPFNASNRGRPYRKIAAASEKEKTKKEKTALSATREYSKRRDVERHKIEIELVRQGLGVMFLRADCVVPKQFQSDKLDGRPFTRAKSSSVSRLLGAIVPEAFNKNASSEKNSDVVRVALGYHHQRYFVVLDAMYKVMIFSTDKTTTYGAWANDVFDVIDGHFLAGASIVVCCFDDQESIGDRNPERELVTKKRGGSTTTAASKASADKTITAEMKTLGHRERWANKEGERVAIFRFLVAHLSERWRAVSRRHGLLAIYGGDADEPCILGGSARFRFGSTTINVVSADLENSLKHLEKHGEGDHMAGRAALVTCRLVLTQLNDVACATEHKLGIIEFTRDSDVQIISLMIAKSLLALFPNQFVMHTHIGWRKILPDGRIVDPAEARENPEIAAQSERRLMFLISSEAAQLLSEKAYGVEWVVLCHILNGGDYLHSIHGMNETFLYRVLTSDIFSSLLASDACPPFACASAAGMDPTQTSSDGGRVLQYWFFRRWIMCCYAWKHKLKLTCYLGNPRSLSELTDAHFEQVELASYLGRTPTNSQFDMLPVDRLLALYLRLARIVRKYDEFLMEEPPHERQPQDEGYAVNSQGTVIGFKYNISTDDIDDATTLKEKLTELGDFDKLVPHHRKTGMVRMPVDPNTIKIPGTMEQLNEITSVEVGLSLGNLRAVLFAVVAAYGKYSPGIKLKLSTGGEMTKTNAMNQTPPTFLKELVTELIEGDEQPVHRLPLAAAAPSAIPAEVSPIAVNPEDPVESRAAAGPAAPAAPAARGEPAAVVPVAPAAVAERHVEHAANPLDAHVLVTMQEGEPDLPDPPQLRSVDRRAAERQAAATRRAERAARGRPPVADRRGAGRGRAAGGGAVGGDARGGGAGRGSAGGGRAGRGRAGRGGAGREPAEEVLRRANDQVRQGRALVDAVGRRRRRAAASQPRAPMRPRASPPASPPGRRNTKRSREKTQVSGNPAPSRRGRR